MTTKRPITISLIIQELLFIQSLTFGSRVCPRLPRTTISSAGRAMNNRVSSTKGSTCHQGSWWRATEPLTANEVRMSRWEDSEQQESEPERERRVSRFKLPHPFRRLGCLASQKRVQPRGEEKHDEDDVQCLTGAPLSDAPVLTNNAIVRPVVIDRAAPPTKAAEFRCQFSLVVRKIALRICGPAIITNARGTMFAKGHGSASFLGALSSCALIS